MSTLVLPAFMKTFRGLADGTLSLTFDTQELSPDQFSALGKAQKKSGILVFRPDQDKLSPEELKEIENIDIKISDDAHKSPSTRLRSVLYLTFKENPEGFDSFESYYISKMEQIITHFKGKLDTVKENGGSRSKN